MDITITVLFIICMAIIFSEDVRYYKRRFKVIKSEYYHEVNVKHWWWPFWVQSGYNSFRSVEAAIEYINDLKNPKVY